MSDLIEFDLAKSLYQTARFRRALTTFRKLAVQALRSGDMSQYFEIQLYLIRILFEQEREQELAEVLQAVYSLLAANQDLPPRILSRCYYVLGILRYSQPQEVRSAKSYFSQSIQYAIEAQDHESLAYALYGRSIVFYKLNESENCLSDLENLSTVLNSTDLPDIRISLAVLLGLIRQKNKDYKSAIQCFEDALGSLRIHPSIYLFVQTLNALGLAYLDKNDFESAQMVLDLARMSCPEEELPRTARVIRKSLQDLRQKTQQRPVFEFEFDPELGIIERKGIGRVSLNSQFILRDLLTLFLKNPETIFTKEELIEKVWAESYSPLIHDNKIYVTMKRLRKTLEPIFQDIEPILRVRNGYCLNHVFVGLMKQVEKAV